MPAPGDLSGGSERASPRGYGPLRNALLQLGAQLTTAGFTAVLTIYLVRALGAKGYGVFAIAVSVSALAFLPSDFGLSAAVARFLAERREDAAAASAVLARGLQLKLVAGGVATLALFAAAPLIARAYGARGLTWPLRWVSIAMFGMGLIYFLNATFAAVRTVSRSWTMYTCESLVETGTSVMLVVLGMGVTGAALGRAAGYVLGGVAGLLLARPIIGPLRHAWARRVTVPVRSIARYAGSMMIVDAAHTAIVQVDVLFIAGVLTVSAAGPFAAVTRLFTFLNYIGTAAAAGVAPRLARGARSEPDAITFATGLKYVVIIEGALLAPLVVWAKPIVTLVLGPGYGESIGVMRALAPTAVLGGLAPVLALGVNYLGEARRRVPAMLGILVLGAVSTYVLLKAVGVIGAALADDVILLAHVAAHLWICRRMIEIDMPRFLLSNLRTLAAAAVMGLVLAALGTHQLSAPAWIVGGLAGTVAFAGVLVVTGEITRTELRSLWRTASIGLRRVAGMRVSSERTLP